MDFLRTLQTINTAYSNVLVSLLRCVAPILMFLILFRCVSALLTFRREPETWAWLQLGGEHIPITHWENVIGRSKHSDIVLDSPNAAKTHGTLVRDGTGVWRIFSADGDKMIFLNGERVDQCIVNVGDVVTIGDLDLQIQPVTPQMERTLSKRRMKGSTIGNSLMNVILLTVLQMLFCLSFLLNQEQREPELVMLGFMGLVLLEWSLLIFYLCILLVIF